MSEHDSRLFNLMAASCHLIDAAEDWQHLADDARLPIQTRVEAQEYSDAVYSELGLKRDKR